MHREMRSVNNKLVQATDVHKVSYSQYWATLKGHSSLGYHIGELFFWHETLAFLLSNAGFINYSLQYKCMEYHSILLPKHNTIANIQAD